MRESFSIRCNSMEMMREKRAIESERDRFGEKEKERTGSAKNKREKHGCDAVCVSSNDSAMFFLSGNNNNQQ